MNRYDELMARIGRGEKILIDGATGTEVERRGVPIVENAWFSSGAIQDPDLLRQIHADYIAAGANIVISNTFATARHVLAKAGWGEQFETLNRRSVELAVEARTQSGTDHVLVAGGIAHWSWSDVRPTLAQLRRDTVEQARLMADAGADLIMLEMMVDIDRMCVLIEASQQTGLPVWVGLSLTFSETGEPQLWRGETLREAIAALQPYDIPLVSIMHTEVQYVDESLALLQEIWDGPIGVYAHSGTYEGEGSRFDGIISPSDYAAAAQRWLDSGISMIGGCCGLGVDHIALLNEAMSS